MTISAYIVNLLKHYENIEIDTDHVAEGSDKYGLFRAPGRVIREFNDESYEVAESYQFNARQAALSASERKEADEWLEDLVYWADDFPYRNEFPELDKGREVTGIAINGNPYPMAVNDTETLYEMSIAITYIREREGL